MDAAVISRLESSFEALAPALDAVVADFYDELFRRAPGVRGLFQDDLRPQRMHLAQALRFAVGNLRDPAALVPGLQEMGVRHLGYGARPEHYPVVRDALLEVMGRHAGGLWTDRLAGDWTAALDLVAEVMVTAANEAEKSATPGA